MGKTVISVRYDLPGNLCLIRIRTHSVAFNREKARESHLQFPRWTPWFSLFNSWIAFRGSPCPPLSHLYLYIRFHYSTETGSHTQSWPGFAWIFWFCYWEFESWVCWARWVRPKMIKEWRVGLISFALIGLDYSTPANATLFLKATFSKASNQFPFPAMRFMLLSLFLCLLSNTLVSLVKTLCNLSSRMELEIFLIEYMECIVW